MKVAQVIWSNEALNDLEIIYDFLAEKSPQAAQRIVESILSRTSQLESFPESGARLDSIKVNESDYIGTLLRVIIKSFTHTEY
jgi:plasmid stabilization system protein ParE